MIRRPPRSTPLYSSAASDVYKRQGAVSTFTEETETVVVELLEGAAALAQALERRGLQARLDGSRLILEGVSASDYDTLRDAIVESDALLYRLAPTRHGL